MRNRPYPVLKCSRRKCPPHITTDAAQGLQSCPSLGASARSPVGSARAVDRLQRECGLWTVPGIACGIDVPLEVERLMSLALQEGETQTEE